MADEALYERYKDALRRGHVASLHDRLDEALDAYAEASRIAPERPTPHASAGAALLRRRRPADALRYYEAALVVSPRDEAALLGRAHALAALQRRGEAADGFDTLADQRASGGRLADAVDAARRGLELAEGRERRRTLERLIDRLRASEPDEPGRLALELALRVLEGRAITLPAPAPVPPAGEAGAAPAPASDAPPVIDAPGPDEDRPAVRPALERDLPPGVDARELSRLADAAIDAGDGAQAVERLLDVAALHRTDGRIAAAMDACYLALASDPDHMGLHLALVQLYDDSGWTRLAGEKLDLLDRLVALDADPVVAAQVSAARAARA
jgi:tetratricopeptide (TPR) repeat protein